MYNELAAWYNDTTKMMMKEMNIKDYDYFWPSTLSPGNNYGCFAWMIRFGGWKYEFRIHIDQNNIIGLTNVRTVAAF